MPHSSEKSENVAFSVRRNGAIYDLRTKRKETFQQMLLIFPMDAECRVYRRILLKEYNKGVFLHENHKKVDLNKVCAFMVKAHIDCAPVLTMLYRVAATAGYASARVE